MLRASCFCAKHCSPPARKQRLPLSSASLSNVACPLPFVPTMACLSPVPMAASKPYLGLAELTYPFHDRDILVTACGRICLHRKKINVSTVLAGQTLGIKEVDDGIWLASFMQYDLGYFDLEQKTLQPLDNPF